MGMGGLERLDLRFFDRRWGLVMPCSRRRVFGQGHGPFLSHAIHHFRGRSPVVRRRLKALEANLLGAPEIQVLRCGLGVVSERSSFHEYKKLVKECGALYEKGAKSRAR